MVAQPSGEEDGRESKRTPRGFGRVKEGGRRGNFFCWPPPLHPTYSIHVVSGYAAKERGKNLLGIKQRRK